MTNTNDARRAHEVLDGLFAGRILSRENEQLLRSFLPDLPKQKTLEEIYEYVDDAWLEADGPESKEWLHELHEQLKGLKDTPAVVPELPAGMRIADHEEHGRVVVAPIADSDGERMIFCLDKSSLAGAGRRWAHEESLTFIEDKTAHPEFLETEVDYENAPAGTIVACEDSPPWHKFDSTWLSTITHGRNDAKDMTGVIREVLRWSWGNE